MPSPVSAVQAPRVRGVVALARLVWFVAIGAGLTTLMGPAFAEDDPNTQIEAREQDLDAIEQQVESLTEELVGQNSEREGLIRELEERERDVAALAVAGRELDQMVREQGILARGLRTDQADAETRLASELERLGKLVRTAHAVGRGDALRLLLNQQDPLRATRVLSYFAYLNRERVTRIREVEDASHRLAQLAEDAERETARLEALAEQQDETRKRLETAKTERQTVLAQLELTISSREADLTGLRRDAENLRRLVEHLRQRAQIQAEVGVERASFDSLRGRLPWPLATGRLEASYGSARQGTNITLDGVLLVAGEGEEVRAVHDGRVVYADWLRGFGMLLVIDHGGGYQSFYGHNEALLKEVGEWVSASEVVALSGKSGGRGESVLYFAIRHNGDPLDPSAWCG